MARKTMGDIASARLSAETISQNFSDVAPLLSRRQAVIEAQRCFYCYDAPCITACPTEINIPGFIKSISTDNLHGAATQILEANIFGGQCARVCPTEILCEGSCVRNGPEDKAIEIGALQRYATDWVFEQNAKLFTRAPATGKRVAVVGAGPGGLACAHALAMRGNEVVVFEARQKSGGLNEYGIAAYKVVDFSQDEVNWLLSIGGIEVRHGQALGAEINLAQLRRDFSAVYLAMGLSGVNALSIIDEDLPEVRSAVDFIAALRQTPDKSKLPVGRRVIVIGGGNTAIDAAIQSKRLGAERVSMVYRRGSESMSATAHEQEFAASEGVHIIHFAKPAKILKQGEVVTGMQFEHTALDANAKLIGTGEYFTLEADVILKAIGQSLEPRGLDADDHAVVIKNGRIVVDGNSATNLKGVFAGGDCVGGKVDLTVQAVADGKKAALSIDAFLLSQ